MRKRRILKKNKDLERRIVVRQFQLTYSVFLFSFYCNIPFTSIILIQRTDEYVFNLAAICLASFIRSRSVLAMFNDGHVNLFTNLYHYYVTFVVFVCVSAENTSIKKVKSPIRLVISNRVEVKYVIINSNQVNYLLYMNSEKVNYRNYKNKHTKINETQ